MAQTIRLDKFLSERGAGTRSEVKEKIRRGKITVNGLPADRPELKIDPASDAVEDSGIRIASQRFDYFMYDKPAGLVTATKDTREPTVMEGIRTAAGGREAVRWEDFFPAGRLDKDAEGLLLITNDGELAHRLLSPKKHIPKTYYALVSGSLGEEAKKAFAAGLPLGGKEKALPARLELLSVCAGPGRENALCRRFPSFADGEWLWETKVTVYEGKFHQVKRMFEAVGGKVQYLKRLSIGSLLLDESLSPGGYRRLYEKEWKALMEETGYAG